MGKVRSKKMMLAEVAAESRPTARGPTILHASEEIKDVPLLQSSSAASTIESPSTKNTFSSPGVQLAFP